MDMLLPHELIIDNFAGGGGTSTGLEAAFGRPVDIAINHDPEAIAMHRINHPHTKHLCESVWDIDPIDVTNNEPVGLVWLSPDCKHFSKAKGAVPVDKRIRGLAWVAARWAAKCRPRIIMLENVEEFKTWGPLNADGKPCKDRKGKTFKSFLRKLHQQGYKVEYRELKASDYGVPTIRNRFFLVARRDGLPIHWPKSTHGNPKSAAVKKGKLLPWRTAAECIDWSIPTPSIFDTSAQIKAEHGVRAKRPLADNTCKRIAVGMMRYVVDNPDPFIVKSNHTASYYNCFRGQQLNEPLQTVTQIPGFALTIPYIAKLRKGNVGHSLDEPLHTMTAGGKHFGIVAPVLTECANASSPRCMPANEPLRTICAQIKGGHHALIAPFIAKNYTGVVGSDIQEPLHTVTAIDHNSLVIPHLSTCTSDKSDLVAAFLSVYYGNEKDGQSLNEPARTITSKAKFGLVTVKGVDYKIVDIGFRMLQPRELFRAQGFGDDYIIDKGIDEHGKTISLTKEAQTRMVGNSVCPPLAQALVMANFKHELNYSEKIA
ncbi:MAG: DNA cytosine methyltransferase [Psychrobacter alimentarius]